MIRTLAALLATLCLVAIVCAQQAPENHLPTSYSTGFKAVYVDSIQHHSMTGTMRSDHRLAAGRVDTALMGSPLSQVIISSAAYTSIFGSCMVSPAASFVISPWWWISFSVHEGFDNQHGCYKYKFGGGNFELVGCLASSTVISYLNVTYPDMIHHDKSANVFMSFDNFKGGNQKVCDFELPLACADSSLDDSLRATAIHTKDSQVAATAKFDRFFESASAKSSQQGGAKLLLDFIQLWGAGFMI